MKSWRYELLSIEKALPEFGNPDITHNVEFSLHPIIAKEEIIFSSPKLPLRGKQILAALEKKGFTPEEKAGMVLLGKDGILRNACTIATDDNYNFISILDSFDQKEARINVVEQYSKPYAMFECKRVGIEEGMRKGPQTIEKAKQRSVRCKSIVIPAKSSDCKR